MGLFGNKKEAKIDNIPRLPELPKLPGQKSSSIPRLPDDKNDEIMGFKKEVAEVHQLPSFPSNNLGNKFSQETIKNAISRDESSEEIESIVPQPPQINTKKEIVKKEVPEIRKFQVDVPKQGDSKMKEINGDKMQISKAKEIPKLKENEPIFIRIDKFEESLKVFSRVKQKVSEIEKLLTETKEIKNKEENELDLWGESIQKLKLQIEKVNEDIFSKIE